MATLSYSSIRVVILRVPTAPAAPRNKAAFSERLTFTTSLLGITILTSLTISSKKPCLEELLSLAGPMKPPPAVILGNFIIIGGTRPSAMMALTRRSIGTLGSTRAVSLKWFTSRTLLGALISTEAMRSRRHALFVEPWLMP